MNRLDMNVSNGRTKSPDGAQPVWLNHNLHWRIFNYLSQQGIPGVESIRLTVTDGNVRLDGAIASRSAKWRCYECCRHVAGVFNVIDRLEVLSPLPSDLNPDDQGRETPVSHDKTLVSL